MADAKTENLPSLEKAGEILAKRVQGAFIELLTEDQMKAMVKTAIAKYTTTPPEYNGRQKLSPLDEDIKAEVESLLKPAIQNEITAQLQEWWNEEKMMEFVKKCAPQLMATALETLVLSTIQSLKNNSNHIY